MPHTANAPLGRANPTDPHPDRNATALPPNLANVLRIVQILLTYGRHLAGTLDRRAAAPGFHLIAKAFGTSRAAIILAHIRRGLLRAAALERLLLRRAARGRDLTRPPVRIRHRPAPQPQPQPQPHGATPAEAPPPPKPAPRPAWRDDWLDGVADPLDPRHLPTAEALQAEMRRRSIGCILGDINADLGIAPGLCLGRFWDELWMTVLHYDGSPATRDVHRWRRQTCFQQEQDRSATLDLSWPLPDVGGGRGDILQVLGFLIGQDPVEPPLILPSPDAPSAPDAPDAPDAPRTPDAPAACAAPPAPRPPAAWVAPPARGAATGPPGVY